MSCDSSVLELGCGTGTVTRMLAKEGYDCVGLDMSEDMLSIASEKHLKRVRRLYIHVRI